MRVPRRTYDLESRFAMRDSSGQWRHDERMHCTRKEAETALQEYQGMNPSMQFRLVVVKPINDWHPSCNNRNRASCTGGEMIDRGELWSFLRSVMSQGVSIQHDYVAGKYVGYEAYSARLDAAASERADEFWAAHCATVQPSACNHFPGQSTCEWCGAVQPERCCLDYPRCDCNSPPEPDSLPCGHPASLLLRSAETGEPLYCELCDDKSGRRDAVQCETELRAEVDRLKAALKTVGDDYPGSSCQQWCYEAAGIRAPTLQPCGHPWKAQHDFKCILCSAPGDATYAQLAEEQRFLHGAAADAVEVERLQRLMQKIMARCADLLDEDQFNELDAMTRATDPTDAAT